MGIKEDFLNAVIESISCLGNYNKERNDNPPRYYDDEYAEPIKKYFKNNGTISYEINRNNRWHCTPICSLASSGRLCYLDFKNKANVKFEVAIENDLHNSRPTKMDVVIGGDEYYECKCQEIVGKSHSGLSKKYLESNLFNSFGVKKYTFDNEKIKDEESKEKKKRLVLAFKVSELNIQIKGNPDYRKLHFDLKQLMCHLIAIANENKEKPIVLKYVFYVPSKKKDLINNYKNVKTLYEELDEEINAIWKEDTAIKEFCNDNHITLEYPEKKPIDEINDFNYLEAFGK